MEPAISVGMAVFDDFNGIYFSIQSLRLYHAEAMRRAEIVVVDNNPEGEEGKAVRDFLAWVRADCALTADEVLSMGTWLGVELGPAQAQAFVKATDEGLADPRKVRAACFEALRYWNQEPTAALVDEVALWATRHLAGVQYIEFGGTVGTSAPRAKVFEAARGRGVVCMDAHVLLWPGALDRLLSYWNERPGSVDILTGPILMDDHRQYATHFEDVWRDEMWGVWGVSWACECGHPFETREVQRPEGGTPACQLWSLAAGKGTRLCPGCGRLLPETDWPGHEISLAKAGFHRLANDPEVNPDLELEIPAQGLGLFAMRKAAWPGFNPKFRGFGGEEFYIHEKVRQRGGKALCLPFLRWDHRFFRPGGVRYPLNLWNKVRNYAIGHQELGLSTARLRGEFVEPRRVWEEGRVQWKPGRMSEDEWQQALAGREWPAGQEQPAPGCGQCQQAGTLEERLRLAILNPSDLNEHVPTLKDLAGQCRHVTSLGGRHNVSTVALLAGQPDRLVIVDAARPPEADQLERIRGKTALAWLTAGGPPADVEPTDLLFVDTTHTADQVFAELSRYGPHVRRWLVLHDTVIYGETGEGGGPGLLAGIRRWLAVNREWTVRRHYRHQYGLLVLTRDPAEKKTLPPGWRKLANFTKAAVRHGLAGFGEAPEEVYEGRLALCLLCPSRHNGTCGECGCPVDKKASWPAEQCPLGMWPALVAD